MPNHSALVEATSKIDSPRTPRYERQHITSLDGLRGVAVLLVLAHHHAALDYGWIGVDFFFALSGYLITTILRSTRADASYWSSFWIKRVTRILPPFLLLLLVVVLLGFAVSGAQLVAYLLTLGDVMALVRTNFEPLLPLWSLAVEEHFYLVWPFAVLYLPRRWLVIALLTLLVLEPLSRAIVSQYTGRWEVFYYLTPFRLDGLCWGAMLALFMERVSVRDRIRSWSAPLGVTAVGVWIMLRFIVGVRFSRHHAGWVYNSAAYSLLALLSVALVAFLLTHQDSWVSRTFSSRPLVWIGRISYGLYLYQVPVKLIVTNSSGWSAQKTLLLDAPLVVLLSWLSFKYFEQPIIRWGRRLAQSRSAVAASAL